MSSKTSSLGDLLWWLSLSASLMGFRINLEIISDSTAAIKHYGRGSVQEEELFQLIVISVVESPSWQKA